MTRRRRWLWVGGIVTALVVAGWAAWVATGPRTVLPPGAQQVSRARVPTGMFTLSPDGSRFVSASYRSQSGVGEVIVFDRSSGAWHIAAREPGFVQPMWLADGALGYFHDRGLGSEPKFARVHGRDRQEWTLHGIESVLAATAHPQAGTVHLAAWTPVGDERHEYALYVLDLEAGTLAPDASWTLPRLRHITTAPGGSHWVVQTDPSAGARVVRYDGQRSRLDAMQPPRAARVGLPSPHVNYVLTGVSPDGRRLLFLQHSRETTRSRWWQRSRQ